MKQNSVCVYLLLGSNMGDRRRHIENALALIAARCGSIVKTSAYYETAAWGNTNQAAFYNLAAALETTLAPLSLIKQLLEVEVAIGRVRQERWGPRSIDIDIIFYGNQVIDEGSTLKVPHPEMQQRKFVLVPLAEIAPEFKHPVVNQAVVKLLEGLEDTLEVKKV